MDRSMSMHVPAQESMRLVHRERKFFFVGELRREVIYSVVAEDLAAAWENFRASRFAQVPIFSVIKTESEIYLAQQT